MFCNVQTRYEDAAGRIIHIPSEKGRAVGMQLRRLLVPYRFDRHYRHLGRGGHIAVLHRHRSQAWFATADIENFFGSVSRTWVAAALRRVGVREHRHFAKWSTVKGEGGYVLPVGFPASAHLATLVMQESPIGGFLQAAAGAVTVQVYLDDISLSSDDPELLGAVHDGLLGAIEVSGLRVNARKSSAPARRVELFGCVLERGRTIVSDARQARFHAQARGARSAEWFERYREAVETGNDA